MDRGILVEAPYESLMELRERAKNEIAKVVIGQERAVELLLVAALARGHVLIEGPREREDAARTGRGAHARRAVQAHPVHARYAPAELTGVEHDPRR